MLMDPDENTIRINIKKGSIVQNALDWWGVALHSVSGYLKKHGHAVLYGTPEAATDSAPFGHFILNGSAHRGMG